MEEKGDCLDNKTPKNKLCSFFWMLSCIYVNLTLSDYQLFHKLKLHLAAKNVFERIQ